MLEPEDLINYRDKAKDYARTQELKKYFKNIREKRDPFYLNLNDLDKIIQWKLLTQYNRQKDKRSLEITEKFTQKFTELAFNISHPDEEYETYLKIKTLMIPRGIGIGIASAILALCFPEKYAVIDFRTWRQVFSEERDAYTINQYLKYLKKIKKIAIDLGWQPQEVDFAIWAYDKEKNP